MKFGTQLLMVVVLMSTAACVATHERNMNRGEKTLVSDRVSELVDENDGVLDIRNVEDEGVRCERIRIVGTHMVTRLCSTRAEREAMAQGTSDKVKDRFFKSKCLDQSSLACKGG